MKTKVLIIGYYGAGNLGDEVLLDATINLLKKTYDSPEITVLTSNVEDTTKNRKVEAVYRGDYIHIIKTIKNSHLVIGGGGSMLQNVTSNESLIYYLGILRLAKLLGKKVALLGNGIGPLNTSFYQSLTKNVLKKLDAIVLRDKDSYNLLKNFGLTNIYLGNDLVYSLDKIESHYKIERKVLINLRKWDYGPDFLQVIVNFVEYLLEANYKVSLISFQAGNDDLILKDIYNRIKSDELYYFESHDYGRIIQEIGSGEIFIGMRLHGLIFSSVSSTSFIALSYDPKVSSLSNYLDQEYFEDLNNITFNAIINRFEKVYENRKYFEEVLNRKTKEIRKLNHINEEVLNSLK